MHTHWALGPSDLKPYANDAFCEGINRLMLHQATCQPPSDGKPGFEFCAASIGRRTSPGGSSRRLLHVSLPLPVYAATGTLRRRCLFLSGRRAADSGAAQIFRPPLGRRVRLRLLQPRSAAQPDVGQRRTYRAAGRHELPLLVFQNCTSPVQEICDKVGCTRACRSLPFHPPRCPWK